MLDKQLEFIRQPRLMVLNILKDFTLEQLNTIPPGFNNNIAWNLGHLVAAQLGIWYKRADLEVDERFYQLYKADSKPEGPITQEQLDDIKERLITSLDAFEKDYAAAIFTNYPTWTTRYGAVVSSIDEAIAFLPFHDGLHIGYMMSLRKLV
ncbi:MULTISPECIES: DinB family protein [unclassified Mucilaginibacter]|uniref:DinB family protein n=1 Tax=unclassified Mucilaginibacter TaxID=2617802 RepID=UPI002AC9856D|nr:MULTISPECIES: DinB family protein [unclassified Mucilaginibacter]MEB0262371.1 DinB family protein [Mucilaginibacter sp. 10I4]MEB0280460.1 DinB family protein [Mucilaginibacter sp. 10B2]MEB0300430.1 DinB family protein [Mucilaginibacter sp. 5C4]WPX23135.1 DinB family protein [Mucilaginibacter sp. 5C4]